jgi:5-methyltetrahydrofolate--homocysteine methyltransferase
MTKQEFIKLVQSKIVLLDGATGSNLQMRGMPVGVCPEEWILENPQTLIKLQEEFLEAGSDIILAPTFTANRIKLEEYGLEQRIAEINKGLVALSRKAVEQYAVKNSRRVYIAADLSMTGVQVQPVGPLSFEELVEVYKEQMGYIISEGVDLVVIETMMSLQECRAALLAVKETCELPVMVSLTFDISGRTLFGTDPKTAVIVLQSMGADAVGVNCSTGPDKMYEIVMQMKKYANIPIMAKPNAGLPMLIEGKTVFPMEADEFAAEMEKLVEAGANLVGGCCGSTAEHIKKLADVVKNKRPEPMGTKHIRALTTERNTLEIELDGKFMIVGERINPTGKKDLQAELKCESYNIVNKMAQEQAELGASILDINVGMNGIDEKETMLQVIQEVITAVEVPLCIDSSHVPIVEAALRSYPGRALINSISLEKEKFEKLIPIAKKYGAMFILLPLSDLGLPKDTEEKKEIIHTILDRAFALGLTKEDIVVDGLVNTVGANQTAAIDALWTIRYCKEELGVATIVGLSNISFGLPERQFINSTFLSIAIQAGLTMAIANPSQDLLVNTALAADLLRGVEDSATRYIDRVTSRPTVISSGKAATLPERISDTGKLETKGKVELSDTLKSDNATDQVMSQNSRDIYHSVIKGNKKIIISLVEQELSNGTSPETLIEQVLIPAITEVGRLYDQQIYFLPQLISGAEAMKTAIDYLEPKLQKKQANAKGTIVIATVAGDIHDIGKNLVSLMLKNYGFRVIDLGKDVPTEHIIQTAIKENADIIALSALMTTTMVEMERVVEQAKRAGLKAKIIIGGAVITESYADEIGADGYSPDAQAAVALVKKLMFSHR